MSASLVDNNKITGWWTPDDTKPEIGNQPLNSAINVVTKPLFIIKQNGQLSTSINGSIAIGKTLPTESKGFPLYAYAPPLHPQNLGDIAFKTRHNIRYAYIAGAMANGITSVNMVENIGKAGMLGFFGAAGLTFDELESSIIELKKRMGTIPFGSNLIHNPTNTELENATVQLYLTHGINLISAAAYMSLTLPIVYFRVKGIHRDSNGEIICPNKIIAKVSRIEVAKKFFSPPPDKFITQLVEQNMISAQEAELAKFIPMADDLSAEADSGGHTDNRPAIALLPTMLALRDEMIETYNYPAPLCVGLGGGISTPSAAAAAFAMGAAYILTGSVNQSCIESGISTPVKNLLSEAKQADVAMAPSADMFQLGGKVQVLKRGTMFPIKANKLYDLYSRYECFEDIPEKDKVMLEKNVFQCSFDEEWEQTKSFFEQHDPKQIEAAKNNPKHKMALVFRSYLGRSSKWAISGNSERRMDYQIWCGPSIGAFNEWVKGTFLEKPENRDVVTVAMNLLFGASVATRLNWLQNQNINLPANVGQISPMELSKLLEILETK